MNLDGIAVIEETILYRLPTLQEFFVALEKRVTNRDLVTFTINLMTLALLSKQWNGCTCSHQQTYL